MQPSSFGNYILGITTIALVLAYILIEIQAMRADTKKNKTLSGNARVTSTGKALIGGDW
jgi:hypothetical protein